MATLSVPNLLLAVISLNLRPQMLQRLTDCLQTTQCIDRQQETGLKVSVIYLKFDSCTSCLPLRRRGASPAHQNPANLQKQAELFMSS